MGKVSNRGLEGFITYHQNISDLTFNVFLGGSYSKNKVDFIDEVPGLPLYQQITGHPVPDVENAQYRLCYEAIGVFKDEAQVNSLPHWYGARPGDIIFKDVNADGKIDGLDRIRSERSNIPAFNGNVKFDV